MASGLLKPLAVFCSQSQSQYYIKSVSNLGDTWRSLPEQPLVDCDESSTLIETNFDLVLIITNGLEEQRQSNPTIEILDTIKSSQIMAQISFGEIQTMLLPEKGTLRDKAGYYHITTFSTGSEEVAWNVAGVLLAWRIVMVPEVGRLEFTAGSSKYLLEKGKETNTTLAFLQDQVDILAKGPVG
ncbi:hypothetical protein N7494_011889 [Penicillium frequentans]|uniref:Uncharacterized protein n=1 Tax=Penicillium frequentans TaxID=3151616 RepID=A0AAD6CN75_9EURO|nr:hypothetical protein N7494_011889 [Penicillium glabrum]